MSDYTDYFTDAEIRASYAVEQRVRTALDRARTNMAELLAAVALGQPAHVVDLHHNHVWNRLRSELSAEERLHAILMLLHPAALADVTTAAEQGWPA